MKQWEWLPIEITAGFSNAGQSRSGAVVTAYVMRKLQMEVEDALEFVKKMKPDVE